ncbi:MAG: T9SS type A sorting domain-containing protein, partial [Ferruginibacter sp.]
AVFAANAFQVTTSSTAGGGINTSPGDPGQDPLGSCGDDLNFNFYPDPCFSVGDVLIDGISVGAVSSYTFINIHANHTVHVIFVATPYTIDAINTLGGTILPGSGTVNCGSDATYTITASVGFSISDVSVDGISVGPVTSYTFTNVTANHSITATYTGNSFTINSTAGANGTITPAGANTVAFGSDNTYTITSNVCYHVDDVLVDNVSVGAVTSYTFTNTIANHSIQATFALNTSLEAPVISGPVNICAFIGTGEQVTYTAFSAGASGYNWVIPPTNISIVSGQGTATLVVTFQNGFASQANRQIRVTALSPCGNSPLSIKYLLVQAPGTPATISGSTNVCEVIGTANTLTYSIPAVAGASSYTWTAQLGSATIEHPNGPGVNDTIINVAFTTGFTSSNITVQAVNGCGVSGTRTITLTRVIPSTPSPVSGPTNVCANIAPGGAAATYTTSSAPGVAYNWMVPAGATGLTGQGTSSISFTYPNGFTTGMISVVAANGCGVSGTRSLNVSRIAPSATSVISVVETQGCPDRIFTYSIPAIPSNATSALWTVPTSAGVVLISGQGTVNIIVSYPAGIVNGNVTVQATNNCGNSAVRSLAVHLTECGDGPPPPPGPRTAKANTTEIARAAEGLQFNVFPNPTTSDFKLQVVTAGNELVRVRVIDMQGRTVNNISIMPKQTVSIGAGLKAGAYLMEVRQGDSVKTTKLLKF